MDTAALLDADDIAELTEEDQITYRYWGDDSRVVKFLSSMDADVLATSRISAANASQKRPVGSSHQKMPARVTDCPKACDRVKALSPAMLESHGGIAHLVDIGWLKDGDPCILHFSDAVSSVGFLRAGCIIPYLDQSQMFTTPSAWIRSIVDEGSDIDKKNFEMISEHLHLRTKCYRFLHFPVFNNATLHQLAGLYVHSRNCEKVQYPGKKIVVRKPMVATPSADKSIVKYAPRNTRLRTKLLIGGVDESRKRDRVEEEDEQEVEVEEQQTEGEDKPQRLTREDIIAMFTKEITPDLHSDNIMLNEQRKEIINLRIRLSAFHQLFSVISVD